MSKQCLICKGQCKILYKNLFDDRYGTLGKYSIYKCSSCGFGRLQPIIDHNKTSKFYAEHYPLKLTTAKQVKKTANIQPKWLAWLTGTNNTAHWLIKPKSMVLDIGSASGTSLIEIKKLGGKALGVEPDPNAQVIAKKLKLQVHKGFITNNPFPGKKFDFITASQVIEHDSNPKAFLKAARARLNKKGKIILSFPNSESIFKKIFRKSWINWHIPYHVNHFTKKSFRNLVKQCDLKIVTIATVTPNLWTLLQFRVLFSKVKMGEKNPIWFVNLYEDNSGDNPLLNFLVIFFMVSITVMNRIIDLLDQGDSFIVILEKDEQC